MTRRSKAKIKNTDEELFPSIDAKFFARDTLKVAREMIGTTLVRRLPSGELLAGRIVETEAYLQDDPACHAYRNFERIKKGLLPQGRSALLYGPPGISYVYLNYGIHWLFNVVTEKNGVAGAVLVRALDPLQGVKSMTKNRGFCKNTKLLTSGPGRVAQAMAIGRDFNGKNLGLEENLWISPGRAKATVMTSPRIGISQAKDLPWRFFEAGNANVSVLR